MDCDDSEGRVGGAGTETRRGKKRAREIGDGGGEGRGGKGQPGDALRDGPAGVARRTREDDAPT